MKKVKIFVVTMCVIIFSLSNMITSCCARSTSTLLEPINVIIILDTSNRVSKEKHPDQIEKDIEIVKETTNIFTKYVKERIEQTELKYDSRLRIFIPNQIARKPIPSEITNKLIIKDRGGKDGKGHASLPSIEKDLDEQTKFIFDTIPKLYEFVVTQKQTGSDIWKWFRDELESYLLPNCQNLILCISDGYLDFDKAIQELREKGTYMDVKKFRNNPNVIEKIRNGEGLLSIDENFSHFDVKFLMVEITLRGKKLNDIVIPYEKDFDIIKAYWETWLNSMGIEDCDFIEQSNSPIGELIESFLRSGNED